MGQIFSGDRFLKYIGLFSLLAIWEISGRAGWVDERFLPSLTHSIEAIFEMWEKIYLFMHIMVSLSRVMIGLLVATFLAVPAGYIFGKVFPGLEARLDTLLRIFGLINPYCLFPLFVVFFGVGELAKLAVLAWVCLWPIFFHTLTGVRSVDPVLIKTARSMNASEWVIFSKITLPAAAPAIFAGLRIGVEMSFFILIAAEMTGATAGLGWIVHNAGANYQVVRIYGAGIIIVLLGVLINRFLIALQGGLFFWKESTDVFMGKVEVGQSKKISKGKAFFLILAFFLVLGVGLFQIAEAERMLNDPDIIPEYRVYAE